MITAELYRQSDNGVCTLGTLEFDGLTLFTLEQPWRGNARRVSCIPAGEYLCEMVVSPRFGRVYAVRDVPSRSHILFHAGNTAADTQGCILVGLAARPQDNRITQSRIALQRLHEYLGRRPFTLRIFRVEGTRHG